MFLFIQCLFFVLVQPRYLTDHSANNFSNSVEEIQHAICKIDTKDIKASANATITRQLKGVCTSKEMNFRIDQLQKRLFYEINLIKKALHIENDHFSEEVDDEDVKTKTLEAQTHDSHNYDIFNTIESVKSIETNNPQTVTYSLLPQSNNITTYEETSTENIATTTTIKNLQTSYKRDLEATKNNGSIQNTELGKSFLYYWKIYDINEILNFSDTHIDSPIFYLLGHPLNIQFYPHHLGTQYAALQLSDANNFIFKHRFTVLNQIDKQGDLSSQILGTNNAALFRISNQKLSKGNFTIDGSLIIKILIALN